MQTPRLAARAAALLPTLAPAAFCQTLLHTFVGAPGNQLTWSDGVGDVNADGYADLILCAPNGSTNGLGSGTVWVRSGRDGSVLYTFHGNGPGAGMKEPARAGDIDGDGHADFMFCSRADSASQIGIVRVHSGADGSVLHEVFGTFPGDSFGGSCEGLGDVDADGVPDFFVGAPGDDTYGTNAGLVKVYSGVDAHVLYEFHGDPGDEVGWGWGADAAGDVNGDGHADVIVAGRLNDSAAPNAGKVWVHSGFDGQVLWTFVGDHANQEFGKCARSAGDVDGDGRPDIIVSSEWDDSWQTDAGIVRVYSGRDGHVLHELHGVGAFDRLGHGKGIGDVDGDGHADFMATRWGASRNGYQCGAVRVYSGADASVLLEIDGLAAGDVLGRGGAADDVDGDGRPDIVLDAQWSSLGGYQSGAAWVFSLAPTPDCDNDGWSDPLELHFYHSESDVNGDEVPDACQHVGAPYCGPNTANSTGQPGTMIGIGSTLASANDLTLRAESLPHYQWGYFLTSRQQGFVLFPGGSQGVLCLGGPIGRFLSQVQNSGSEGAVTVPIDLTRMPLTPNVAVQAGETWRFQFWHRDVVGAPTSNFTEALAVTFD